MKKIMSIAGRIVVVLLALCLPLSAACSVGDNQVVPPAPGIDEPDIIEPDIIEEEKINFCEIISEITGLEITSYDDEDMPSGVEIGYDDSYCSLDTNPYDFDDFYLSSVLRYIQDMNKALGLPSWLYNNMINTTWSQGVQTEEFDNVTVRYTYHPDKGLEVTYYLK